MPVHQTRLQINENPPYPTLLTPEDMQEALDKMPMLKQQANRVQKHLNITERVSKIIEERRLLDVSELE